MQRFEPGRIMTHPAVFPGYRLQVPLHANRIGSGTAPQRVARRAMQPGRPRTQARRDRPCAGADCCAKPPRACPHGWRACRFGRAISAGSGFLSCPWSCRTQLLTSRRTWRERDHVLYARLRVATSATVCRHSSGVERVIGNDEVHSSILCGGTISPHRPGSPERGGGLPAAGGQFLPGH